MEKGKTLEQSMRSAIETLSDLSCAMIALFLDFDGTLTPLVDHPDQVQVDARNIKSLVDLKVKLNGALAVVSGRDIAALDRFLSPHTFSASGIHGFENRIVGTEITRLGVANTALGHVVKQLEAVAASDSGLLLEQKLASVALHYRANPELSERCRQAVANAVAGLEGLVVIDGKMVIEVKGHRGNKGAAVEAFMQEQPFQARTPVFLGDDVTDEAGFAAVNSRGGISIKIGDGTSVARFRLKDTAEVADWLAKLAEQYDGTASTGEQSA